MVIGYIIDHNLTTNNQGVHSVSSIILVLNMPLRFQNPDMFLLNGVMPDSQSDTTIANSMKIKKAKHTQEHTHLRFILNKPAKMLYTIMPTVEQVQQLLLTILLVKKQHLLNAGLLAPDISSWGGCIMMHMQ